MIKVSNINICIYTIYTNYKKLFSIDKVSTVVMTTSDEEWMIKLSRQI